MYRIFSIKRLRCLFQTWPDRAGVYLIPGVFSGPMFLRNDFYSLFLKAL